MSTPSEQLHILSSGVADLVPKADLVDKLESGRPLVAKLGVDPTAPDLHLGHAVPLRKLRQFQDLGHRVILIIGDFTALIGDPSGRSATRPPLTRDEVEENAQTYMEQAFKILDPEQTELRRNSEWLAPIDMELILKLTGRFTVARMLERDDFSTRYKEQQSISLHEFLYPVMVAYDSYMIDADVELGGTDQLFNFLAGRELMEKMGKEPQVCMTLPLLEGTDGVQKMSKSYGNYVGLTDEPGDMFGKVMSIPDGLMVKYFRLATGLPVGEIDALEATLADGTAHPGETKRRLAREIVTVYHDADAATAAEEEFDRLFKRHEAPEDVPEVPLEPGDPVFLPAALKGAGLASSNSEARRLIDQGGVKIEGEPLASGAYELPRGGLIGKIAQVGKRRFVRFVEPS